MADHFHPNFPPSLSITPNIDHFENKPPKQGDFADAFGVEAQREAISRYGIAGRVWEAAYTLCTYVDPNEGNALDFDPPFMDDPHEPLGAIELGSGTGIVAASVARAIWNAIRPGGFVIATDLPDVCPLLEHNLGIVPSRDANRTGSNTVFLRPFAWGILDHAISISREFGLAWTLIVYHIPNLQVYFPELFGPLLRTLIHLTSPSCVPPSGPPVKVVISYKIRSLPKEAPFWSAFGLWFSFRSVLARRQVRHAKSGNIPLDEESNTTEPWGRFGEEEGANRILVFVAHRRPESTAWHAPEADEELMGGVGARGTTAQKGDDTFETMLLMTMGIDGSAK